MTQDVERDPSRLRAWRREALVVFLGLLAVTAVYMAPLLSDCHFTVMGDAREDAQSGVWTSWVYKTFPDAGPWPGAHTDVVAAPEGQSVWQPHLVTSIVLIGPQWVVAKLTSPVCSWNLMIMSGFVLTGLCAYLLLRWLSRDRLASFLGMFAYTFSAYRIEKAGHHLAYVHAEWFPLALLACFMLWRRPSRKTAAFLAGSIALLAYTDGYYLLFGPVMIAAFFATAMLVDRGDRTRTGPRIRYAALAAGMTAVLVLPVAVVSMSGGSDFGYLQRSITDATIYSARLYEYVIPGYTQVVSRLTGLSSSFGHGSAPWETTLYVGVVMLFLALVAVRSVRDESPDRHLRSGLSRRSAILILVGVGLVALISSLPPTIAQIGGIRIPGPSRFFFAAVPLWRVFARFFIVVHLVVVCLATLGLAYLLKRAKTHVRVGVVLVLGLVVAFESAVTPFYKTFSYEPLPAVYEWLADVPRDDIVVEYPMTPYRPHWLDYQWIHEHPVMNPIGTDRYRESMAGLADAQTLPSLRAYGVDYVIVHRANYGIAPTGRLPDDLVPVHRFGSSTVYRIAPGRVGAVRALVQDGFSIPFALGWSSHRAVTGRARIMMESDMPEVRTSGVTFDLVNDHGDRLAVRVTQEGRTLWEGTITSRRTVSFRAKVGVMIDMTIGDERGEEYPATIVGLSAVPDA